MTDPKRPTPTTPTTPPTQTAADRAVRHLSRREHADLGKQARGRVPRSAHAALDLSSSRPDPIDLLERQAQTRVADLVPIRYGRMLVSPFTFFRGAALVMASDLASTPTSGLVAQICGDAHLSNFGVFASPERSLVFDVNDFDETLPGPWEWDIKRLAASAVIASRERGFTKEEGARATTELVAAYRNEMHRLAGLRHLDVWYSSIDVDRITDELAAQARQTGSKQDKVLAARLAKGMAKARTRDNLQALEKLTRLVDGQRRIISDPPLIVPADELLADQDSDVLLEGLRVLVRKYRRTLQGDRRHLLEQFRLVDAARKVVGVGSVGTRAWILLLVGADDDDPLFLQAKQAEPSVLEEFVGKSRFVNHGQRVVTGQHLMQASSDIFLGWERVDGVDGVTRDYYVRQLRDWKGSFDVEQMVPAGLTLYVSVCARALARAHARSGDRIAIASYLGTGSTFDRAIVEFAEAYADQNQRDYDALRDAVATGRLKAETGI